MLPSPQHLTEVPLVGSPIWQLFLTVAIVGGELPYSLCWQHWWQTDCPAASGSGVAGCVSYYWLWTGWSDRENWSVCFSSGGGWVSPFDVLVWVWVFSGRWWFRLWSKSYLVGGVKLSKWQQPFKCTPLSVLITTKCPCCMVIIHFKDWCPI